MKKFLKVLLIIIAVLVCTALLILAFVWLAPQFEKREAASHASSMDWMSYIADETPVNEIFIPGTHDSATQYSQLAYFSKCQDSSIAAQLEDGFRYLDIRLGVSGSGEKAKLIFYHGFCKCREGLMPWSKTLELGSVLDDCYAFLEANPTETVIFAVKMEQGSDEAAFQSLLQSYISEQPDKWYLSASLPTLGECRGKLVLMRRYENHMNGGSDSGIQMLWAGQGSDAGEDLNAAAEPQQTYTLLVQDRYKYDEEDKWTAFTEGIKAGDVYAGSDGNPVLRLNFLSTNGTPAFGHPYKYAKGLNEKLRGLDLSANEPSWVIVDYSDAALAGTIFSCNF